MTAQSTITAILSIYDGITSIGFISNTCVIFDTRDTRVGVPHHEHLQAVLCRQLRRPGTKCVSHECARSQSSARGSRSACSCCCASASCLWRRRACACGKKVTRAADIYPLHART